MGIKHPLRMRKKREKKLRKGAFKLKQKHHENQASTANAKEEGKDIEKGCIQIETKRS